MLTRLLFFLFFSISLLQAQNNGDWQSFVYPGSIVGMTETDGTLWLASGSTLLQIDKRTGKQQLLHFQNSDAPPHLLDLYASGTNAFTVLSIDNTLYHWQDGEWTQQQFELPGFRDLVKIIGSTEDGQLLLRTHTEIYVTKADGTLEELELNEHLQQFIYYTVIDQQGRMWVSTNFHLQCFATDGTLLFNYDIGTHYPSGLAEDNSGNIWLAGGASLHLWDASTEALYAEPNIMGNSGLFINGVLSDGAILYNYESWLSVSYLGNGNFQQEEIAEGAAPHIIPSSRPLTDREGNLWFLDRLMQLWRWQVTDEPAPTLVPVSSWIPVSELTSLALDSQGKVWTGGFNGLAYLMGGSWSHIPFSQPGFSVDNADDIAFNEAGNPLVGTSTLFFFGFPSNSLREWTGTNWDTLEQAVLPNDFGSMMDIAYDRAGNVWALQQFNQRFSVRYQGQWFRYTTGDVPGNISSFTCLEEAPDGSMWIGTDDGLLNFDGFRFSHISAAELGIDQIGIRDIAFDETGKMWLAADREGILREIDGGWIRESLPPESGPVPIVHRIAAGPGTQMWATLLFEGALHYNGTEWEFWSQENTPLFNARVSKILVDQQDRVWFTGSRGISMYAPDQSPIEAFQLAPDKQVQVYPNPGCCQFRVHWLAESTGQYDLQLHQLDGQLLRQWPVEIDVTGETFFEIRDRELPAGTHLISVRHDNALIGTTLLIVIQ